jgi:hypothetical protein
MLPSDTDWLGIQQGATLADMKKITYADLMGPLQEQIDGLDTTKADKDTDAVAGNLAYFDGQGNPVDSGKSGSAPDFESVQIGEQLIESPVIPDSTNEIVRIKNQQAGKVHTILELRSPDTSDTEATLSLHNVTDGVDDWVCDLSFHDYAGLMKMVSVISHFTGENAGSWEWITRYTDGTDYSMIERMLMKLDGQTGYLMVAEDGTPSARLHIKQSGYLDEPAVLAEIDSSHVSQPEAIFATDKTNFAHTGNLVRFKLVNVSDTGVVLKLENAGTGDYINADNKFKVDKDGEILSPTITRLNADASTDGSVLKAIKDTAEDADFTPAVGSGISAVTIVGAVNELGVDVEGLGEYSSDHEVRIQTLEGIVNVTSWAGVQKVVREGLAEKYFSVGDQLVAEYDGVEKIWDIIGFDIDTPADENFTHSMTIQSREVLRYSSRIDAPQAMYNAVTSLPAGTHIFTTNGVQYQVTTTVEIPAGGVLYIATRSEYIPLTLTSYQPDRKTAIETGLVVTATTGVDTLTPINDHVRMRYGSNRYIDSALRQWLNSDDAIFTWTPKGLYDMPSTYETEGFVNILDADLKAVIGSVDKQVARATYDGGGQDTFEDKVFLLSRVEMGLGTEGVTTGEVVYPFWDGATNADRIKYQGATARYWWLRSPYVSITYNVRIIGTDGYLSYVNASNGIGVSPACVII